MRLYKFLSIDHAVDNLVKRRIKISEYGDMNDPYEFLAVSVKPEIFGRDINDAIKNHGAVCLSATESEPLLWSHYAEKHRGCCIAFEVAEGEHLKKTIPVDKPDEIFVDISRFIEIKRKAESQLAMEMTQHLNRVMLSKYSGWNYEKEFRFLIKLIDPQKDGKLYFAEFDEKLKPVEVLLGAMCTQDHEEKLRYAVNRYEPPLPIIKMSLAADEFKIVRRAER
jgi:hypothetical protein